MNLIISFFILFVYGCGTAKTQYIETKYDLCMKGCSLKYSQYDSKKLSECRNKCVRNKYNQN